MTKSFKTWMEDQYPQSIQQQPQIQSNKPRPPQLGVPPWPAIKVGEVGQAVGKGSQEAGLASKTTQQRAKTTLDQQVVMKPETQGPGYRPASGAEGGAKQLAPRP